MNDAQYDELARLLSADIQALVPLAFPHNRPVSESHIRLMAVLMRRWLVGGDLQKLLSPLKQTALFDVQANSQARTYAASSGAFRYYLTAGIRLSGRPVSHIYETALSVEEVDRKFMREGRGRLNLKEFLAQPRLMHDGNWFNTCRILRFVANKIGGNHLVFDRTGEWVLLEAANSERMSRYWRPHLLAHEAPTAASGQRRGRP